MITDYAEARSQFDRITKKFLNDPRLTYYFLDKISNYGKGFFNKIDCIYDIHLYEPLGVTADYIYQIQILSQQLANETLMNMNSLPIKSIGKITSFSPRQQTDAHVFSYQFVNFLLWLLVTHYGCKTYCTPENWKAATFILGKTLITPFAYDCISSFLDLHINGSDLCPYGLVSSDWTIRTNCHPYIVMNIYTTIKWPEGNSSSLWPVPVEHQ